MIFKNGVHRTYTYQNSSGNNETFPWTEVQILRGLQENVDVMFLLICGFFIFFMKAGFAFLEAGAVRRKSVVNSLFRNFMDLYICGTAYWLFGYGLAFGNTGNPFVGHDPRYFALAWVSTTEYAMWFFQMVFGEAAGTIMSGAVAERANSLGYIVANFMVTGFVYPIVTHWVWSPDGWLINGDGVVGFTDFAGSGCVHVVGGACALVASLFVGPRMGRFDHNGASQELKGHNLPFTALGALILFFGFLAFNAGSQKSISQPGDGAIVGRAVVNTVVAACSGGWALTFLVKIKEKRWSLMQGLNGALAGMVAICAGCASMHPWAGCCTGIIAGFVYYFYSQVTPRVRIDDPVDAIALHLGGGSWGVMAYAIFADDGILLNWSKESFLVRLSKYIRQNAKDDFTATLPG
ncbi:putative ammonium transporter 1 isoform X2 [Paramacrobiotus metropolitanus]|uniref:putative ammonium transporter 1 isoform X2 n=1 Tax=Paramacrobiotus metropolitanus TaxID=2943436 RepID=UPI002445F642|nr:putative ammonium transporter 1 isoform X2 [Paramacrobiotus metropolitanus]